MNPSKVCEKGFEKTQVVCIPAISFIRDVTVTGCVTPNPVRIATTTDHYRELIQRIMAYKRKNF